MLLGVHPMCKIKRAFGKLYGGLIFLARSNPLQGEQVRIYYQQRPIYTINGLLMIQCVWHVVVSLRAVSMHYGIVKKLIIQKLTGSCLMPKGGCFPSSSFSCGT